MFEDNSMFALVLNKNNESKHLLNTHFKNWIGKHKAVVHWFHNAHVSSKGESFAGDHVNLYGMIYEALDDQTDGILERGIGLTGDQSIADPMLYLAVAMRDLPQWPNPSTISAGQVATTGADVIRQYLSFLDGVFKSLEQCNCLSLGLDDKISGFASELEDYLYLLQQRSCV